MTRRDQQMRLLLTGGGTGGHLFPAVATAQAFRNRFPDCKVLFVGTNRKIDTNSLARYGFDSETVTCYGLKGKNIFQLIRAVATLPFAYMQALKIIRNFRPDVILGVGGYVTGPVVAAGKQMGIATVIHEQNSVPGLANRKLGKIADRVCLSLPGSGQLFDAEKIVYTGNPVRENILRLGGVAQEKKGDKTCILVLGGSQGAHAINELVPRALALVPEKSRQHLKIIHQTGSRDAQMVEKAYRTLKIDVEVAPFFNDMEKVYRDADFLISRAGATTLSELAVLGKPAVLIPYPFAADNHQQKNADYYVQGGGAVLLPEAGLTPEKLAQAVQELLDNPKKREKMAASMKKLAFPDAPERIVACCLEEIARKRK
ncbi:undecaprenyldiphospho-muramoylpentapeptide beta-N-acetylglucosaminyltransferase [Desulforhopalus singaporensis]|uniref:UDP-N-acetylglucosamine--N-acetylmuramyl-(pentapeptide) pyrophosphoryl-undecaprenol N-acetylglucosamine transferase n=1 Tax=Desulforhopalus singaporensis TaxID=91360 RepID=A0A1H0UK09_9BACT|nr:undecaprenyldiphospho-muramoylpentapeptide beta-N-acetylglucosaminyltransferase [Desulforhopalus singaporensis]SDP66529.1 UDP-N-acetylglucosamine-N-acetylmuramylpentapeptide N-acetylglucosamine transferase [Desulforhopalus singaporensis]